jgi:transposase
MPRGRAVPIHLTEREREVLEGNVRRRKGAYALAQRSRIILLAADGLTNQTIATRVGVSGVTVSLWRRRFAERRLAGLQEQPRRGRPKSIRSDQVQTVIATTLESAPEGAAQWSTRLMARKMGMSQSAISRIWRASGLSPHRMEAARREGSVLTSDSPRTASRPRRP